MSEIVESAPVVNAVPSDPAAQINPALRFEIPSFTEKKAEDAPKPDAPKVEPPPTPEGETPVVEEPKPPVDPEAERVAKARAERQRTNRLFKQVAEEKVRREAAERELEQYRKPAAPNRTQGAPDPAQFTDIGEYTKAVREHERAEAVKEYKQQQQMEASQAQQNAVVSSWEKAQDRGAEKYENFDQVVGELKPNSPWAIAIMQSENADDVAFHLGTNIAEAQRIIALPPVSQIYEIGKLSAKLMSTPPAPKPASKAPAPIAPVNEKSAPDSTIVSGMDFEKFRRVRNKQMGRT